MGQGLHTKLVQVCSHCLGIPIDAIHISETSTCTVANSSGTGASASSDMYGMAVKVRDVSEGGRGREGGRPGEGAREWEGVKNREGL